RKLVLLVVLLALAGLIFAQWHASYNANPKPLEPPKPEPATVPRTQGKSQTPQAGARAREQAGNSAPALTLSGQEADQDGKTQDSETRAARPVGQSVVQSNVQSNDAGRTTSALEEVAARGQPKEKPASRGAERTLAPSTEDAKNQLAKNQIVKNEAANSQARSQSEKARESPARREKPSMALLKAQRYLQGRGVPQNCDQGLMYLKAATQQNDPNAAVQMAALYSSGHCVHQDRAK